MLNLFGFFVKPAYAAPCNAGAGGINLGECLRLSDDTAVQDVYTTPAFLINLIVRNVFVFAGIIIFLLIVYAGFKLITGGKKGAEDAKTIITNAGIGFLIMFTAYWVVQFIKIVLGVEIPL